MQVKKYNIIIMPINRKYKLSRKNNKRGGSQHDNDEDYQLQLAKAISLSMEQSNPKNSTKSMQLKFNLSKKKSNKTKNQLPKNQLPKNQLPKNQL